MFASTLSSNVKARAGDLCPSDPQMEGAKVGAIVSNFRIGAESVDVDSARRLVIQTGSHQWKENRTSVSRKKCLTTVGSPSVRHRPPVHLLGVCSSVYDSTDFVLLNRMLLLLNTWCAVRHLFNCDARLTLFTGMRLFWESST
jgi:hypothetical protein